MRPLGLEAVLVGGVLDGDLLSVRAGVGKGALSLLRLLLRAGSL